MQRDAFSILLLFFPPESFDTFPGKLCNSFLHDNKTLSFSWYEFLCLKGRYIHTHTTGILWLPTCNEIHFFFFSLLKVRLIKITISMKECSSFPGKRWYIELSWKYLFLKIPICRTILTFSKSIDGSFLLWNLNWFQWVSKVRHSHGHNLTLTEAGGKCLETYQLVINYLKRGCKTGMCSLWFNLNG